MEIKQTHYGCQWWDFEDSFLQNQELDKTIMPAKTERKAVSAILLNSTNVQLEWPVLF